MRYLAGLAVPDDGPAAFSGAGTTIVELLNCPQSDAFEQQNGRLPSSLFIKQRPWTPGGFVAWPSYQLTLDRDQTASDNELDVETAVAGLAGVVADALAAIGSQPAALRDIAAAHAAWYDVAAAEGLRQEIPLDEARHALLADFARAEREFLVRQTRDLQARLESSGWTAKIREARAMEQQQVDRAKAIGWVSTIAAGLVPGSRLHGCIVHADDRRIRRLFRHAHRGTHELRARGHRHRGCGRTAYISGVARRAASQAQGDL
jgi:hypothetical protein